MNVRMRVSSSGLPSKNVVDTEIPPGSSNDLVADNNANEKQRRHHHRLGMLNNNNNNKAISIAMAVTLLAMTTLLSHTSPWPPDSATRNLVPVGGTSDLLPKNRTNMDGDDDDLDSADAIECRYDGHCPVGRTCAVARPSDDNPEQLPGICRKIPIIHKKQNNNQKATQACLDACQRELEMDEHFFHEQWPEIIGHDATVSSSGRPKGCVLYYKRTLDRMEEWQDLYDQDGPFLKKLLARSNNGHGMQVNDTLPSIKAWEARRFQHVVRVDPAKPHDISDDTWMAYCTEPCQKDDDCQPSSPTTRLSFGKPFLCQQGACQRNSAFWEAMTVKQKQQQDKQGKEMVFITGATASYYRGLQNLMGSIRYWAPGYKVVVYNLGKMKEEQKEWIRQQPNLLSFEWPDGIPDKYPHHVHIGKKYAWKPIIIQEALAKYKMIFWLDAGSTLRSYTTPIEEVVKRNGVALFHGQDETMKKKSHDKTYEWFNFTKDTMRTGPHKSGNTQAYLSPSRYVESLVNCNARCAMDVNCIAPPGATLGNHRFDQTTLSLCAYHPKVWPNHHTEYLACMSEKLPKDPRAAAYKIVFTARQATSAYKNMDGNYLLDQQQNATAGRRKFSYSTV